MNNDLISREALKEEINKKRIVGRFNTIQIIDNAPTVEAYTPEQVKELVDLNKKLSEERPQGEWIEIPVKRDLLYNTGIKYTCSICGKGNCYGKPPFCMYCGAKMQKGGKE